jgi:hypothetical protein
MIGSISYHSFSRVKVVQIFHFKYCNFSSFQKQKREPLQGRHDIET